MLPLVEPSKSADQHAAPQPHSGSSAQRPENQAPTSQAGHPVTLHCWRPRDPTLGFLRTHHSRPCHITASEPLRLPDRYQETARFAAHRSSTRHLNNSILCFPFCFLPIVLRPTNAGTTKRHGLSRPERCARVSSAKIRSLLGGRDKRGGRRSDFSVATTRLCKALPPLCLWLLECGWGGRSFAAVRK
jgi:hypothetical protein